MSGLPEGWTRATGTDVFEYVTSGSRGWSQHYSSDGAKFIRIGNLNHNTIALDLRDIQHVQPPLNAEGKRTRLQPGDIVVSITAELGMVALIPDDIGEAYINQHVALARPKPGNDPRYLAWYLASDEDGKRQLRDLKRGATKVGLRLDDIRELQFPIPPLPEQKRITDKLDTLLARVDACREHLDRVPAILKRFRQSVLAAATSGELTREWREARGAGTCDWTETTVGELIQRIEAGLNVQCEERPPESNERGLVKISAVTWGRYDDNESKTLPRTAEVPERSRIALGDFLISRANTLELVGACVIVEQVTRPVYLSDKVLRLVMPEGLKPWLLIALQSPAGRKAIESRASGNQLSMRNLSQANLREIPISIPPDDEMVEAVDRVRRLLDMAEQIARRAAHAATAVQRSVPATLTKAFRGDLVPQDPNDEPAATLLARIAAQRDDVGVARRSKRAKASEPALPHPSDAPPARSADAR